MKRISDKEYDEAKGCLKRFTYNKLNIAMTRSDLMNLSSSGYKEPTGKTNKINDIVADSVIQIDENKQLNQSIKEYNAVLLAKKIIDDDCLYILEHLYDKRDMKKWEIINNGISERSFRRKHRKLILAVYETLKNI